MQHVSIVICMQDLSKKKTTQEGNNCLASYQNLLNNLTNKYIFTAHL